MSTLYTRKRMHEQPLAFLVLHSLYVIEKLEERPEDLGNWVQTVHIIEPWEG